MNKVDLGRTATDQTNPDAGALFQPRSSGVRKHPSSGRLPQLPAEWVELSYAVETLRVSKKTIVIQFVGAARAVGTTTVAAGFARAAGQAAADDRDTGDAFAAQPVLYIDCCAPEPRRTWKRSTEKLPETLVEAARRGAMPQDPIVPADSAAGVYWARLGATDPSGAAYCGPTNIARIFDVLREHYSMIILDCPAITSGVGSLGLAPHCDGTLVVLRAAVTDGQAVKAARERIERVGGQVIGTVFNRVRRRPAWLLRRSSI